MSGCYDQVGKEPHWERSGLGRLQNPLQCCLEYQHEKGSIEGVEHNPLNKEKRGGIALQIPVAYGMLGRVCRGGIVKTVSLRRERWAVARGSP